MLDHAVRNKLQGIYASLNNWSGYVADGGGRNYEAVHGEWYVPEVVAYDPGNATSSAFWVGLDGYYGLNDLAQAGTEQDSYAFPICAAYSQEAFNCILWEDMYVSAYSAWTELLPNQPTHQDVSLSPNPGDEMEVEVWIGANRGAANQNGKYANASIIDWTQNKEVVIGTPLNC
jgi:hypothetical protein